jgi:glucose-6-phosphate isomerase
MLQLDISSAMGKAITPSNGIPEQEFAGILTSLRRYLEDFGKEREAGGHEWTQDPLNTDTIEKVKEIAAHAKKSGVKQIVWIGIGGSGLGPKVMREVFETPHTPEFILLDTIDPSMLKMYDGLVDWKHAMLVVVSKSGGTLEPMSVFFHCWKRMQEAHGPKAGEMTVGVTDPKEGTLRTFCLENGIRMVPIPSGVGGRYSIFTPVGLLPIALLGGDVDQFVKGAIDLDESCSNIIPDENPAAMLAAAQFLLDTKRDCSVRVIMPYSQRLESVARWNQQLIAESLGKVETANPIPLAAIGTQDQHSLLQQWMSGPRSQWHIFIREIEKEEFAVPLEVEDSFGYIAGKDYGDLLDACYEGTSSALTQAKRPHATIGLQKLDAYHLGQLFYLFLVEVILLGKLYRIDPYGQPAVEIGKKITKKILSGESGQ